MTLITSGCVPLQAGIGCLPGCKCTNCRNPNGRRDIPAAGELNSPDGTGGGKGGVSLELPRSVAGWLK